MTRSLTGKVALVTGAAKGIGAGIATETRLGRIVPATRNASSPTRRSHASRAPPLAQLDGGTMEFAM